MVHGFNVGELLPGERWKGVETGCSSRLAHSDRIAGYCRDLCAPSVLFNRLVLEGKACSKGDAEHGNKRHDHDGEEANGSALVRLLRVPLLHAIKNNLAHPDTE